LEGKIAAVVVAIVVVIAMAWIGIASFSAWTTTIVNVSKIKVSQVNVGYDWLTNSQQTEVLGFDGKENLVFWNNVSQYFEPNHEYKVIYHGDYKGFWPIKAWTLVSVEELSGE